jgi:hypothetical protein
MPNINELTQLFAQRGDLGHVALFLWAGSASALVIVLLRALSAAICRFDDFVRELALFNDRTRHRNGGTTDGNPAQGDAPDPR